MISMGCKLPYAGWTDFKNAIIDVHQHILSIGIIKKVERYSMKYVDLIECSDMSEMVGRVAIDLTIGDHKLKQEPFMVRLEVPDDSMSHIIQMVAPASVQLLSGQVKTGVIVDIDSVCAFSTEDTQSFMASLSERLVEIHAANKKVFFSCLKQDTIEHLEPEYE